MPGRDRRTRRILAAGLLAVPFGTTSADAADVPPSPLTNDVGQDSHESGHERPSVADVPSASLEWTRSQVEPGAPALLVDESGDVATPPSAPLSPRRAETPTEGMDGNDIAPDPFARAPADVLRSLSSIRVELDTPAKPTVVANEFEAREPVTLVPRSWPNQTPEAAAYRFSSRPLWYEDANLERCGVSHGCLQPVVSGAYFFGNTALLPYRMVAEPQCDTVPAKPFCPPGCRYDFCENYLPKPDAAGGAAEALAVTGLIFLIP